MIEINLYNYSKLMLVNSKILINYQYYYVMKQYLNKK